MFIRVLDTAFSTDHCLIYMYYGCRNVLRNKDWQFKTITRKHHCVTHKSTVPRTVMCRQDGRGRFPVLLDDHSKCRTNSQRKSQLS